jgi:hypothetical protein
MGCDEGRLKAWLDDELDGGAAADMAAHLATCPDCRAEEAALRRAGATVRGALARLDPAAAEGSPLEPALARARAQLRASDDNRNTFGRWTMGIGSRIPRPARRLAFGVALVALGVFALFAFAPARQAAAQFLQLFRVTGFTIVPVSDERMQQLKGLEDVIDSGMLGTPDVQREPGPEQPVADIAEASAQAAFGVREPSYLPEGARRSELYVQSGPAMSVKMTGEQLRGLLDTAGITDVAVPEVGELSASIDVPKAVVQSYHIGDGTASPARLELIQVPRPKVTMPEGVDPALLGESLLQLLGVAPDEARRLARAIDWTSTLVIPAPAGAVNFREVTVDGADGVMLDGSGRRADQERLLLWQKDGIVYGLAGASITDAELLQVANSLR